MDSPEHILDSLAQNPGPYGAYGSYGAYGTHTFWTVAEHILDTRPLYLSKTDWSDWSDWSDKSDDSGILDSS